MPRQRFQRKDLKRPDEFVSEGLQLLEWARGKQQLLIGIGAGAALLAVAFLAVTSLRDARTRQSSDDLSEALQELQAKRFAEAATKLTDVSNRWQSTAPGRAARLLAADAQIRAASYDAAAGLLQQLPEKESWPSYLQQHAAVTQASAAEGKGDYAAAAARFAEASGLEGPYTALAVYGEARCRELSGEREQAQKLYERLTREFPGSPENEMATTKLDALKG